MTKNITTSIRLSPEMRERLEYAAHVLHRGKNWVVNEALATYLVRVERSALAEEARRQSILASKKAGKHDRLWEENSDHSGWS